MAQVPRNVPLGAHEKRPLHPTRLHLRLPPLPYPDGNGASQPHHLSPLQLLLELRIHLLILSPLAKVSRFYLFIGSLLKLVSAPPRARDVFDDDEDSAAGPVPRPSIRFTGNNDDSGEDFVSPPPSTPSQPSRNQSPIQPLLSSHRCRHRQSPRAGRQD
jgi:hypothetical protein